MTNPRHDTDNTAVTADSFDRRALLKGATAFAAAAATLSPSAARDFGPGAQPQRYPDPDIVVIDEKRFKAKVCLLYTSPSPRD